jgi:ABC-type branched-subunit amino acid transport system permease subunit
MRALRHDSYSAMTLGKVYHSMEYRYQKLNPLALAIAAGAVAIVISLFIGLPMMGFGGMMGGRYGNSGQGWMMRGYGNGTVLGFGTLWIVGALVAALAGAIFAWVYNAVSAAQTKEVAGSGNEGGSHLPNSH